MPKGKLIEVIEQLGRERSIATERVIQAVEQALLAAAMKRYGAENIHVRLDTQTGEIEVISIRKITDTVEDPKTEILLEEAKQIDADAEMGDEIGTAIEMEDLGRIAAQTAKQVIFQRVREAEWERIYRDWTVRQRTLTSGVVIGQERRNYIVDLGKAEGVLPVSEQIPHESYRRGDRLKAYLQEVRTTPKGPQLILSRVNPVFVSKLFEAEVPEIGQGIVVIKGVVREAGDRTKIAVASTDRAVDPVGACVGMKGSRVQAVVRELRGEKIDIISWKVDPRLFIAEALSPAVVERVGIDESQKSALVVVSDHQLSLAIGKKGQNVRLAARLTGLKIEMVSQSAYEQQRLKERELAAGSASSSALGGSGGGVVNQGPEAAASAGNEPAEPTPSTADPAPSSSALSASGGGSGGGSGGLTGLPGIGAQMAAVLAQHGFDTMEKIAQATVEQLQVVPKVGEKTAKKLQAEAQALMRSAE